MKLRAAWTLVIGIAVVGGLVGCQPAAKAPSDTPDTTSPNGTPTPGTPGETPTAPVVDTSFLEKMPNELKHDGFAYSGLGNPKPTKFRMTSNDGQPTREGEQVSKFVEMRDGIAVFQVERSGDLSLLGTDELAVAKDGIYALKTSLGELDSRSLELPSDPNVRKFWTNKSKLTQPEKQVVTITGNYTVIGVQRVKTPAGEYDALVLTAEGPIQIGDKRMTMRAKSWYVKDIGVVKQTIERQVGKDKPVLVTLEMMP